MRFVGVEAYEAAGGVVRRDLFDDERSRFLSDPALLQRLAEEKLHALAGAVSEDWAWVEARIEVDSHALRQFTPCEHLQREPTPQEEAELSELACRSAELDQQAQSLDTVPEWSAEEAECINLELQDIEARRKAIHEGMKTWGPDAKAHAGAIVTVNREGDAEVIRGLVRASDRNAVGVAQKAARQAVARG